MRKQLLAISLLCLLFGALLTARPMVSAAPDVTPDAPAVTPDLPSPAPVITRTLIQPTIAETVKPTLIPPTPTVSPTMTASASPTITLSPTASPSPTASSTPTASTTPTPSNTPTPSLTPPPSATSQPVFPLRPGTIEGNINDAFPSVRYRFDVAAGDSITIRMEPTSGDLDPVLNLYAPNDQLIGRNDDETAGSRTSRISFTLNQPGQYVVEATRFTPETAAARATAGTFRLTLTISGTVIEATPSDPLNGFPQFSVPFTVLSPGTLTAGVLSPEQPLVNYAVGARQGDLIRVIMTATGANSALTPRLRILGGAGELLSRDGQTSSGETVAFLTAPESGWYLIESSGEGAGSYDVFLTVLAASTLEVGGESTGTFEPAAPSQSYLLDGRIGDQVVITLFTTQTEGAVTPRITLRDLSGAELAVATGSRLVSLRGTLPRTGLYLVEADNTTAATRGSYTIRLSSVPLDLTTLSVIGAAYNKDFEGVITEETGGQFYSFNGVTDDLITIAMTGLNGTLDPYLILMDSDLNELAANDNAAGRRDARIVQFRLPKDGRYYLLTTRTGLLEGTTEGSYILSLSAGQISLEQGVVSMTVRWTSAADLNLFVRDPNGRIISYSRPSAPSGGELQIDSNTGCQTPSAEPVEHIFFTGEAPLSGDYEVWVWNQAGCGTVTPTDFSLAVRVGESNVVETTGLVLPNERYQTAIRVIGNGESGIIEPGTITRPTAQQLASEGGDIFIRYGESLTSAITPERYAVFYRFVGNAGDRVVIRMEGQSGNLDAYVALRDANDNNLVDGVNDDADETTRDARLEYTLPESGEYVIAATRFGVREGVTTGDYRLSLGILSGSDDADPQVLVPGGAEGITAPAISATQAPAPGG